MSAYLVAVTQGHVHPKRASIIYETRNCWYGGHLACCQCIDELEGFYIPGGSPVHLRGGSVERTVVVGRGGGSVKRTVWL